MLTDMSQPLSASLCLCSCLHFSRDKIEGLISNSTTESPCKVQEVAGENIPKTRNFNFMGGIYDRNSILPLVLTYSALELRMLRNLWLYNTGSQAEKST